MKLTPRENQVCAQIAKGLSNSAIGRELRIATSTVKIHIINVRNKLDIESKVKLRNYLIGSSKE